MSVNMLIVYFLAIRDTVSLNWLRYSEKRSVQSTHGWNYGNYFVGLYDKKGRGRKPKLNDDQCRQVKGWAKKYPKNLKKIVALVIEEYGLSVSKRTIKRILLSLNMMVGYVRNPKANQTQ